jgi:hypothetical protein
VRALMVGGGCRGLALARTLVAEGHAVRAVTRSPARRAEIEAAGCECWIGDPDRIGSLRYALDNVTVLLWLLGHRDRAQRRGPARLAATDDAREDDRHHGAGASSTRRRGRWRRRPWRRARPSSRWLTRSTRSLARSWRPTRATSTPGWRGARDAIDHLLSVDRGSRATRP